MTLICPVYSQLNSQSGKKQALLFLFHENYNHFYTWTQGSASSAGLTIAYFHWTDNDMIEVCVCVYLFLSVGSFLHDGCERRLAWASGWARVSLKQGHAWLKTWNLHSFLRRENTFLAKPLVQNRHILVTTGKTASATSDRDIQIFFSFFTHKLHFSKATVMIRGNTSMIGHVGDIQLINLLTSYWFIYQLHSWKQWLNS